MLNILPQKKKIVIQLGGYLKLVGEIVAKVESLTLEGENRKLLHLKLTVDGESLEAQGQGIMAAVKVTEDVFETYKVGEEIMFEEVARA